VQDVVAAPYVLRLPLFGRLREEPGRAPPALQRQDQGLELGHEIEARGEIGRRGPRDRLDAERREPHRVERAKASRLR
jgi:hypothetical protein